jgi:type IV pilus assembly protein PilW
MGAKMISKWKSQSSGFTLIELLVAMAIAGIVMAGVYSVYHTQQRSFLVQEQLAGMQQNLRAAMYYMERELRMAGYNPTGAAGAGIMTANANAINFTQDNRGNAAGSDPDGDTTDPGESIIYSISGANLERNGSVLASNIDLINFIYLDGDGNITADFAEIRSIQITMVAKTAETDPRHLDTEIFRNQQGTVIFGPANDNFRRKRLTAEVRCRNLGLI